MNFFNKKLFSAVQDTSLLKVCTRNLETLYNVLNIPINCTTKEIKESYVNLAKRYHPDKNLEYDSKEKFTQILEAYQVLSKPASRRTYDLKLSTCSAFEYKRRNRDHFYDDPRYYDISYWRNTQNYQENADFNEQTHERRENLKKNPGVIFSAALLIQAIGIMLASIFATKLRPDTT